MQDRTIFCDLDGTLHASDLFWESLVLLIRNHPWDCLRLPRWLLSGRSVLKTELAKRVKLDLVNLPWHTTVVDYLRERRAQGSRVVLATASPAEQAREVAEYLGLFDDVLATEPGRNLKGAAKLSQMQVYCAEHGATEFAYVGDATADLPIFAASSEAILVAPSALAKSAVDKQGRPATVLVPRKSCVRAMLESFRPQQWIKNLLVFVPVILGHRMTDLDAVFKTCLAFVGFSGCASAVYLLNDALDVQADRQHPQKKNRPLAAGDLPMSHAAAMIPVLLALTLLVSLLLPKKFVLVLALYFAANLAYTLFLKRKVLIDVFFLAGMYAIRMFGGAAAAEIPVSDWLMAFAGFFFLSLAFVKRYSELVRLTSNGVSQTPGRGYQIDDAPLVETMGLGSGYLSVLVMALYLHSSDVQKLYAHRWPLWLVCGLILYWISRLWMWAHRGVTIEDPIVFTLKDRLGWLIGFAVAVLLLIAWDGQ